MNNLASTKLPSTMKRFSQSCKDDILKQLKVSLEKQIQPQLNQTSIKTYQGSSEKKSKKLLLLAQQSASLYQQQTKIEKVKKICLQENNQQNLNECQVKKEVDRQKIKHLKQNLNSLPCLQKKAKKEHLKQINMQLIEFIFIILKTPQKLKNLQYFRIPEEVLLCEFLKVLDGFRQKEFQSQEQIQINKDQSQFYILIEGVLERDLIKDVKRSSKKQTLVFSNKFIRNSNNKNKLQNQISNIFCLQPHLPLLINLENSNVCTFTTLQFSKFVLIDKDIWNQFIITLQKLKLKYLFNFIQKSTTINLNAYDKINHFFESEKQDQQQSQPKPSKKKFLQAQKFNFYELRQQKPANDKIFYQKPTNTSKADIQTQKYRLYSVAKDRKIPISNQNIQILVKGEGFINTQSYSIIIGQGSLINTSILLQLQMKSISFKSIKQCVIVEIILEQMLFTQTNQKQFIGKILQIQDFRRNICKSYKHLQYSIMQSQRNKQNIVKTQQTVKLNKFQPDSLILKKSSRKNNERICRYYKQVKTQQSPQKQQSQKIRKKIGLKYANNFCIYNKIVQSEKQILQILKLNLQKKLPLEKRQLNQTCTVKISKQKQQSNIEFLHNKQEIQIDLSSKISKAQNIKKLSLQNRRKYKKKSIVQNLFELVQIDPKNNVQDKLESTNLNKSLGMRLSQIQNIVNLNQKLKLKQLQNQKDYIAFCGLNQQPYLKSLNTLNTQCILSPRVKSSRLTKMSRYSKQYIITQPSQLDYATQCSYLQGFISGRKNQDQQHFNKTMQISLKMKQNQQNLFSYNFKRSRKQQTRRIMTVMCNGRIRQSKKS